MPYSSDGVYYGTLGVKAFIEPRLSTTAIFGDNFPTTSNDVYLEPRKPSSSYLGKINSNVKYEKVRFDSRTGYEMSDPAWSTHFNYLMNRYEGSQYDIAEDKPLDSHLPFYGLNPRLNSLSKQQLQDISYYASKEVYSANRYNSYDDRTYSSVADYIEDINTNVRKFLVSFSRTAMKAGVPCTTILSDIKENFSITGLDDNVFLDACRDEKREEIQRTAYGKAVNNVSNCCLDISFNPSKYTLSNETFDGYKQRLKTNFEFTDFVNSYFN